MKVKWLPPLDKLFGSISEVSLAGPTPLPEVLNDLTSEVPAFERYARFGEGDRQPHGLLVCRRGQVLTLADQLEPDDELEMVMMITGG